MKRLILLGLFGIASWYGVDFHGKPTASGETFNMFAMTAAHKTLPLGTMIRAVNLVNGKSVIVRINDRGPFIAGRVLDLSFKAAKELDMVERGIVPIRIEVVDTQYCEAQ